nr:ribonuclease H-like domain-containing protein [Tanacetum cinerariifolium]
MTGNRALLTNFMETFLGTVRFGNNDFAVIAGYGDVVIGSMIIKKVYYVEGLPKMKFEKDHLCSAYEEEKIHRKHHKSKTAFALNKPLYLLHMDLCGLMRVEIIEFPLAEEVPTASEENSYCQKKRDATAKRIALLVIEFRDSYEVPTSTVSTTTTYTTSGGTSKKSGRTVTLTTEDMKKRKNDVKERTTLLLSLPDEHQLRFTEGSKTLEQTFNRLQVIVGQLQFMDVEKKTGKKISIQGSDVAGFDKSKLECFNCHKMGHFAREYRAPRSQDRGRRDNNRQGSKVEEQAPKALMAIDEVRWDWSYMENDEENHALVADEEAPTEFALMANTSAESKEFDNSLCSKDCNRNNDSLNKTLKKEKEGVDGKIAGFLTASKDLDNLIESQRSDKNKEGLGYSDVPPPPSQIYSSPKKDLSWTGLSEFADDTVTDYSRPSPTMESTSGDDQNRNPSVPETNASPSTITPKPFIKFVKPNDSPSKSKIGKTETPKKPPVKYAEQYRKPNKKLNVRGNQRNWNNLKSHQLGSNFVMKKKACFNCGHFDHLSYDCRKRVKKGTSRSQNNTHESFTPRPIVHRPYRPPVKPMRTNMN